MGYGTGGTFGTDAKNIGMSQSDIQALTEKLNFTGERGSNPTNSKERNTKCGMRIAAGTQRFLV